jgi:hypothetical protein
MKSKKSKLTNKNKNNKKSLKKQKGGANNPNIFIETDFLNDNNNNVMNEEMLQTLEEIEEIEDLYIVNIFLKNFVNYEEYTLSDLIDLIEIFLSKNILLNYSKFIILTNINLPLTNINSKEKSVQDKIKILREKIQETIREKNQSQYIYQYQYIINKNSILILITGDNEINVNIDFNKYLFNNNNKIHIINNELINKYYVQIYTELIIFYQRLFDICNKIKNTIRTTYDESSHPEAYSLKFKIYDYVIITLQNKNVNETENHNIEFVRKYNEISQSTWNWFLPSPEIQQLIDDKNNSSAKSPAIKSAPEVNSAPAKSAPAKSAAIPNNSSSICKLINDYDKMIKK